MPALAELALIGLIVGVLVGLTGMGGGALLTPILVLGLGVNPVVAVGSDLVVSLLIKPVGAVVHHRSDTVRWDIVRYLFPTAVPAAFVAAVAVSLLGSSPTVQAQLRVAIGAVLMAGVAAMAYQSVVRRRVQTFSPSAIEDEPVRVRPAALLVIGFIGGSIVGLTSVGSGSLIIVMIMLVAPRLRPADLVGTDLVQAIPLVAAAAFGHLVFGDVHLDLSAGLVFGAIPGVYLGAKAAVRAPAGLIRAALVIVLVGTGLRLVGASSVFAAAIASVVAIGIVGAHVIVRAPGRRGGTSISRDVAPGDLLG